jgi:hypothetical protein
MKTRDINRKSVSRRTRNEMGTKKENKKGRMRRKKEEEEEAVHLSIYEQPCGRGAGRQQLSADVKCQKRHNEMKPLLRGLDIPHCAALSSGCRGLTARINP